MSALIRALLKQAPYITSPDYRSPIIHPAMDLNHESFDPATGGAQDMFHELYEFFLKAGLPDVL